MHWVRIKRSAGLFGMAVLALLVACGGGGSSGSNSYFSLSGSSVQITGRVGRTSPMSVIHLHITNAKAAYVGAGYRDGVEQPNWLGINIAGSGREFDVQFFGVGQPVGTYHAVLTVGVADANGAILQTRDIDVAYTVKDTLTFSDHIETHSSLILGSSDHTESIGINVSAGSLRWTATSDSSWLKPSATSFVGDALLSATIDSEGVALGEHVATLTIADRDDPSETDQVTVHLTVTAPELSAPDRIIIGGDYGLDRAEQCMSLTLGTGSRSHPWTLTSMATDDADWLVLAQKSGNVAAEGTAVSIDANPHVILGGSHESTLRLQVDVDGVVLQKYIAVVYNKEPERLATQYDGVSLAKLPTHSVLTRDIHITSTYGRTDVPWVASSNASWLLVSPSGVTGGTLRLEADPRDLPVDKTLYADVTISSSDPLIENIQKIRVGLWVGSKDADEQMPPIYGLKLVASPVEPLLFVARSDGSAIDAVNFYTGEVVRQYVPPHSIVGTMYVSGDGRKLYALTDSGNAVYSFDVASGARGSDLVYPEGGAYLALSYMGYVRPSALPTMYGAGDGSGFDVATAERLGRLTGSDFLDAGKIFVSADGLNIYTVSDVAVRRYLPERSSLFGGGVGVVLSETLPVIAGSTPPASLAPSGDGSRLYAAYGSGVSIYDGQALALLKRISIPLYAIQNIAVAWDGRFVAGGVERSSAADLWFFDQSDKQVSAIRCADQSSAELESVVVSSDGLRYACTVSEAYDQTPLHIGSMP